MYSNSYAGEQKKVVREPKFCSNTGSFVTQNFCSKSELFKFRDVRKPRFDCTAVCCSYLKGIDKQAEGLKYINTSGNTRFLKS